MIITVGKRKFECVPIKSASDTTEKLKKEKLDKIFRIPQAEQKAKVGPACTQGLLKLPHCILDDRYIKMLKDKEDMKKERRKRGRKNVKRKQKADRERTEGNIKRGEEVYTEGAKSEEASKKVKPETSSSDNSEQEYDDSSDAPSDDSEEFYEGTMSRCSKCQE